MKTKLQIISIALIGLIITSCSSSMNMSKSSSSSTDDIYYTPSNSNTVQTTSNTSTKKEAVNVESNNPNLAQLEEKYSKILTSDSSNIDTVIYKAKSENPYDRILSDSYQDSYERRIKAFQDPCYGFHNNYDIYFSRDYWYSTAYDPYTYNTVIAGNHIWVEPCSVSVMFGANLPYYYWNNFNFGYRVWWSHNYWYDNYFYSPQMLYSPYYTDLNYNNGNYYYGPRSGGLTTNTSPRFRNDNSIEKQIITSRRRDGLTATTKGSNTNLRGTNQEIFTRRTNNDMNNTRLRENGNARNVSLTEPTRRNNNNTYQKPRSTNNDGYIRTGTRNQTNGTTTRDNTTRGNSNVREGRNTTPTYNKPNRVDTSTERTRNSNTSSSNRESTYRGSSDNRSSGSTTTRSSSGSNSGSTSNQNNNSNNTSRRK